MSNNRYEAFVRKIVATLDTPQMPNTLSPTERVMSAKNLTDALLEDDDDYPLDLSDENAVKLAAIIAASAASDA